MPTPDATSKKALALHKKLRGKLAITPKASVRNGADLALVYTPGVGAVSSHLARSPKDTGRYTMRGNSIAVVSDGSAVLGLGNLGPEGALPVMEGKCLLFKQFAGIDAVPIVLATQDVDEIVQAVLAIAPSFGGINLEDIAAPRCFAVEDQLKAKLSIPVMHDDQHGTAIVILAGLVNALRVTKRHTKSTRVVLNGAGAAGTAIAKLLLQDGIRNLTVCDSRGIVSVKRTDLSPEKRELARLTGTTATGTLADALVGADVFIGVSAPNVVTEAMVRSMAHDPIIFALANPTPEIMPDAARRAGARVVATGRSDFPNQLNNALVFPGVFRGALDNGIAHITDAMKRRAAYAIADLVRRPTANRIVPSIFSRAIVPAVAKAIRRP